MKYPVIDMELTYANRLLADEEMRRRYPEDWSLFNEDQFCEWFSIIINREFQLVAELTANLREA